MLTIRWISSSKDHYKRSSRLSLRLDNTLSGRKFFHFYGVVGRIIRELWEGDSGAVNRVFGNGRSGMPEYLVIYPGMWMSCLVIRLSDFSSPSCTLRDPYRYPLIGV